MKTAVADAVVPPRLAAARAEAEKHGLGDELAPKTRGQGVVQGLHTAEGVAATAEEEAKKRRAQKRGTLPMFCDHIRVEAAMRRRLDDFEPRIAAIEAKAFSSTDAEFKKLQDQAMALQNEVLMGGGFGGIPIGGGARMVIH